MKDIAPRGLCVYCGHARPPDAPTTPCGGCGRDAKAVTWEQTSPEARDATSLAWRLVALIGPAAYLLFTAVRWSQGAALTAIGALFAVASLVALPILGYWAFRRPWGTWAFYTDDFRLLGHAIWSDRTLVVAAGYERVGTPILLAQNLAALTEGGAAALGVEGIAAAVRGPLGLDDDEVEEVRGSSEFLPDAAPVVVGMVARGTLRAFWRKGWRVMLAGPSAPEPTRELALQEADATLAQGAFEARVLEALTTLTREVATAHHEALAHYRAGAQVEPQRVCAWDDVIDLWEEEATKGRTGVHVSPDAAQREAAERALTEAAKSAPDLLAALLLMRR
jgi:hypothetical protein